MVWPLVILVLCGSLVYLGYIAGSRWFLFQGLRGRRILLLVDDPKEIIQARLERWGAVVVEENDDRRLDAIIHQRTLDGDTNRVARVYEICLLGWSEEEPSITLVVRQWRALPSEIALAINLRRC